MGVQDGTFSEATYKKVSGRLVFYPLFSRRS